MLWSTAIPTHANLTEQIKIKRSIWVQAQCRMSLQESVSIQKKGQKKSKDGKLL